MPFYDYVCTTCEHGFEELVAQGADNPACPKCAALTERQIPRSFAVGKAQPKGPALPPCARPGGCPSPGGPGACGL